MVGTLFDIVVVGAGHAGCEAAAAAARMGARVAVVTLSRATVARMPCNPAVGGVGKGHLVVEVDALGGLQGWAADRAGLQFRVLNSSRGPAVWGPRAQCDKQLYGVLLRRVLTRLPGVTLVEGEVVGLLMNDHSVTGVRLARGERLQARAVILTAGTFLGGVLYRGSERRPGGRFGERPSLGLGRELAASGIELRRFKTGTPPRLARDSIDYSRLTVQRGDPSPRPFSWRTVAVRNRCVCWTTRTPEEVQGIIADNLHRSPLYAGHISGVGPRYCPSIEDKVMRFPHHREHVVFLEPEGLSSPSMYVNGLSTSLPRDVQERVVHAVPGLEGARFLRHGYAVEYDVVAPRQVDMTLRSRSLPGLYVAGQLLGTSGYEEAAALGLVAGVNAALEVRGRPPWVAGRDEGYVGVLVDDVCGADHREPYRMFTSRAEHRLLLGVDSARQRLMETGHRLGLVSARALAAERRRWEQRDAVCAILEETRLRPDRGTRRDLAGSVGVDIHTPTTWAQLLRRPEVDPGRVAQAVPALGALSEEDRAVVVGLLRYDGYLRRQQREVQRVARLRHLEIPRGLAVDRLPGLSREVVEALERARPRTIAEAARLPGVTPAAVAILVARTLAERGRTGPHGE